MNSFKTKLGVFFVIAAPVAFILFLFYTIFCFVKRNEEINSFLGKKIVVGKDTLVVINKSALDELQLSNGRNIDFELAKKISNHQ